MRGQICMLIVMMSTGGEAVADTSTDTAKVEQRFTLSKRIEANLNDYSNTFALRLELMTGGLVDMRFDLARQRARVNLGGGDPAAFRLYIDSNILIQDGRARVQSRVDVAISGYRLAFEVPAFDLNAVRVYGDRAVQLSLPLFEGAF